MNQVEKLIEDVRKVYEEVSGRPAPSLKDVPALTPFPPGVDPVHFLALEYEQLKGILGSKAFIHPSSLKQPWYPVSEVFETGEHFIVCLDLPGMDKQSITCSVENNALVVRGERKFAPRPETTVRVMERAYGPFEKIILLPDYVKTDHIDARLNEGVLEVKLAKQQGRSTSQTRVEIH
jgi:HSP20 family protein